MRVLVSGAGGALGGRIAEELSQAGHAVTRAARRPSSAAELRLDLADEAAVRAAASAHDAAILCPILTVAAPAARWLAEEGAGRIIVFSSNNVGIDRDSPVYAALKAAEEGLAGAGGEIVILRPTMIYGHPGDGNLSRLVRFARRFGFLPCPGDGQALQQPVHLRDVAMAAVQALEAPYAPGPFSVGGPEVVTQGALFAAVLKAAGGHPRAVLRLPLAPLRAAAAWSERAGLSLPLSTAQLQRFGRDKTVTEPAPFGFVPRVRLDEGLTLLAAELAAAGPRG